MALKKNSLRFSFTTLQFWSVQYEMLQFKLLADNFFRFRHRMQIMLIFIDLTTEIVILTTKHFS